MGCLKSKEAASLRGVRGERAPLSPRTASEIGAIRAVLECSKPSAMDGKKPAGCHPGSTHQMSQGGVCRAEKMLAMEMLKNPGSSTQATSKAGGLPSLLDELRNGSAAEKEDAARHIGILAVNKDNQKAIAQAGAIPLLIALLRGETELQREYAAAALTSLSMDRENRLAITQAGGNLALESLAASEHSTQAQRDHAERALGQKALLSPRFPPQAGQQAPMALLRANSAGSLVDPAGQFGLQRANSASSVASTPSVSGFRPMRY